MRRYVPGILVVPALAATLAGCAGSPPPVISAPQAPVLPSAPADFGKPVAVRPPKVGEDARVYAGRERVGRLTANRRLSNDAAFYRDVTTNLGGAR